MRFEPSCAAESLLHRLVAEAAGVFRREWQTLGGRDGRRVAVQILAPMPPHAKRPAIIFSHGANAAPQRYDVLLTAWARHGFTVVSPLHVDSEEHPDRDGYDRDAGRSARLEDYALVDRWLASGACRGVDGVIAAGHSYGALIAQVAAGARLANSQPIERGWRLPAAVIALSPPPPMPGLIDASDWRGVRVPHLCVTGTCDEMPGFVDDWRLHLASHHAVAGELRYALVFEGMDHYFNGAFGRLREHSAAPAVASLNRAVCAFSEAISSGGPPNPDAWRASKAPGVAALAG